MSYFSVIHLQIQTHFSLIHTLKSGNNNKYNLQHEPMVCRCVFILQLLKLLDLALHILAAIIA